MLQNIFDYQAGFFCGFTSFFYLFLFALAFAKGMALFIFHVCLVFSSFVYFLLFIFFLHLLKWLRF